MGDKKSLKFKPIKYKEFNMPEKLIYLGSGKDRVIVNVDHIVAVTVSNDDSCVVHLDNGMTINTEENIHVIWNFIYKDRYNAMINANRRVGIG